MEKRVRQISNKKNGVMISKRRRQSSSKSLKNLEQIPVDLIIEILSKLPLKSIARFHCVSKDWDSILQSSDFTNLFLKVSSSRPRLLFVFRSKDKWHFYSAPQLLNPDNNSSSLTIDYHMCFPLPPQSSFFLDGHVHGMLCTENVWFEHGCNDSKVVIYVYNPSSRQSIPLHILKGHPKDDSRTFLGYDPFNKQYKVLCLSTRNSLVIKHEVLILGIGKPAWRTIECSLPQYFPYSPICINGVLYYLVGDHGMETMVVCFDVRSEKFKSVEAKLPKFSKLINYKGKLGVLQFCHFNDKTKSIKFLVLNDIEKNEWLQYIYFLPPLWKDLVGDMKVYIVGMSGNGELVFSSVSDPSYIFFYNLEKNTVARVRIKGMETVERHHIQTFIDHVENLKLI